MSIRIEVISDIIKYKKKLTDTWALFDFMSIPDGFELNQLFSWWNKFSSINNTRIGFNKQPIIVLIYREKEIIGILPLMRVERFKKKIIKVVSLEFFSQSFAGSYLDIIYSNVSTKEIRKVFSLISKQFKYDLINLCYLKEDSLLLEMGIGESCLHAGKVLIPLGFSYERIRSEIYSKNLRHILNKFRRRINKSKDNIQSQILEGKENISKFKNKIKDVSLSKVNKDGMHSIYQNSQIGEIYFNSIINMKKPFCSIYYKNDQLLSYNMGYIKDDVVYAFDAAYNRKYAESQKIGLGILAYDRIVEHFSEKCKELDMGFGLDDYKFRFSKLFLFTHSLQIKGNTLKAGVLFKIIVKRGQKNEKYLKKKVEKYSGDK